MAVPYTIIRTVVSKPETREELHEILSGFVEPTRAEEGCINYDFHVVPTDPCIFMFYEKLAFEGGPRKAPCHAASGSRLAPSFAQTGSA